MIVDDRGKYTVQGEVVQRSRLRVDSRKWIMSKIAPKKYGERVTQEVIGKDGAALIPEDSSTRDLAKAVLQLLGKGVVEPEN